MPTSEEYIINQTTDFNYFKQLIFLFLSPKCYEQFFLEYNFLHVPCLKSCVSTLLGYGIVVGSILVKVPQILKIVSKRSGAGISIVAQFLEMYGMIANVAYSFVKGFPFSAWGDSTFMLLQTALVISLVLIFNALLKSAFIFILFLMTVLYVLTSGITPVDILWMMQAIGVPVMLLGKLIQAYSNYTCKNMGQQSIVTNFLLFAGSIARIFTSVQETGDFIMILTYCLATLANGILFSQFFIYTAAAPIRPSRSQLQKKKKHH